MPLISVVTPVYNAKEFLPQTMESVLRQSFKDFEFIIIDDGSTDGSGQIAASYSDPRIKILTKQNGGTASARNLGMQEATGIYIAFLDADDLMHHQRLEKQVAFLKANPHVDLVGSDYQFFGAKTQKICFPKLHEDIFAAMLFECTVTNSSTLFKRALLPNDFSDWGKGLTIAQDYDLWVRLLERGAQFANLSEVLLYYRAHASQMSGNVAREQAEAKNIRARWLNKLGIDASPAELQLHLDIAGFRWVSDKNFILAMENWLQRILVANEKVGFLPQRQLQEYICARWWSACLFSISLGPWLALKMLNSPLYPWRRRISRSFWKFIARAALTPIAA